MRSFFLLTLLANVPAFGQIVCALSKPIQTYAINKNACSLEVVVQMVCTGGTPTRAGQPVPGVNFEFTANVPISTSAQGGEVFGVPQSVNALMNVDQSSAPGFISQYAGIPTGGLSYSGSPLTGVGGNGLNYTNSDFGTVPNTFEGIQNGADSITFTNIPLDPTTNPNGRKITVRFFINPCKANSSSGVTFTITVLGKIVVTPIITRTIQPSASEGDPQLFAAGRRAAPADSPSTYTVTPSSLDLGPALDCFQYLFTPGSAPANKALNAALLGSSPTVPSAASATLVFNALFPACVEAPATGSQDAFGFPTLVPNYGTGFQAVFNNIPAGVSVFVETTVTNSLGSISLSSPGTAVGSAGLTQLPVTSGSATALWEAQSADPTQTGAFMIPVYFAYQSGVASPSHITVVQSEASPPGGEPFLQPPASLIQPVVFSINTGATTTPKLTATVDSRPCIVGVTFWTNNACAPDGSLLVTTVSDSASVQVNATITSSGGLTYYAPTPYGSTPTFTEITPNASNATPSAYQETLTLTGIGAESSVSVSAPFTVTVLPANNPVFELNAVYDAFSYQSENIAPGQIYTIFGTNFGPSTLVSGTVDASGKLSTTVANTQVMFDGIASPLLYAVNGQLSGVAPFELTGKTSTNVQIVYNGLTSPVVAVPVVASSISIASADGSGGNGAVVLNKDGTLNTVSNPASAGDTVVIYAAYAGPFANGVKGTDGRTTTGAPYPMPAGTPTVSIGGVAATSIPYFGNAPGFLESVMQINVVIPAGVPSSPYNPLVISAGGVSSTGWTTIAVQ